MGFRWVLEPWLGGNGARPVRVLARTGHISRSVSAQADRLVPRSPQKSGTSPWPHLSGYVPTLLFFFSFFESFPRFLSL